MNSTFKNKFYLIDKEVTDNKMSLRYVNWIDGPEYPKLLTKNDLKQKFEKDIFFVRKISSELTESELEKLFPMEEQ
jgi:RNA recognition motif-containing protein